MNLMLFAAMLAAAPTAAAAAPPPAPPPANGTALANVAPGPGEIVAKALAADWVAIAPDDLLVMDLAPDARGRARRVVIQLMPAPFSQGWVGNIRKLAAAHWWDGTAVTRVQDNYVAQWGDPEADDPAKAKKLPEGLATVGEASYGVPFDDLVMRLAPRGSDVIKVDLTRSTSDAYGESIALYGWPITLTRPIQDVPGHKTAWPVHCYGMVGVGRNLSPDTGSGAELYAVIGHAPRHLDRNIALVGRVIEGIEHLSSLPRGHGALGFYDAAQGDERVPISAIRLGSAVAGLPAYQYLSTESTSFARYADARANRHDAFFIRPAGGADICNIPVPVRRVK